MIIRFVYNASSAYVLIVSQCTEGDMRQISIAI